MSDDDSSESLWGTDTASDHGDESSAGWDTDDSDSLHTNDHVGEPTGSGNPDTAGGNSTEQDRKRAEMYTFLMWVLIVVVMGYTVIILRQALLGVAAGGAIYLLFWLAMPN